VAFACLAASHISHYGEQLAVAFVEKPGPTPNFDCYLTADTGPALKFVCDRPLRENPMKLGNHFAVGEWKLD
jgi:hypothetical protein